jgi:sec-independent protein translocase protein TatC
VRWLVALATGLTVGGIFFGYYIVLPAALHFLTNYDSSLYNIQIRARDYFSFVTLVMLAVAVVFQVPLFILGLVRIGALTSRKLRKNWRIGIVAMTALAVALPGVDPVTTMLEMVPLVGLYLVSLALSGFFERRWHPHRETAVVSE